MSIRALSFDFHGTLAVPHPSAGALYAERAARFGLSVEHQILDDAFIAAFQEVKASNQPAYGADESDARDFWFSVVRATFARALGADTAISDYVCMDLFTHFGEAASWRLQPHATAAIAWGQQRQLPMVICSNFDARLHRLLPGLGIGPFQHVLPSSLVGAPKPDPELLLLAASLLAIEPQELLHIGDSHSEDAAAAQAAGCPFFHVSRDSGIDLPALSRVIATYE